MIFPDIVIEEWIERHPYLDIKEERCNKCGKNICTDKPFVSKEWIGVIVICDACGFHGASSMVSRSDQMEEALATIFGVFDEGGE